MSIALEQVKIPVKDRDEVFKLHLLIKSHQSGHNLSMADICTLVELYNLGYTKEFFSSCVDKGYYRSEQTVMNAISKMTSLGILSYKKRGERIINPEYLPIVTSDKVIFKYMVGNL